MPESDTRVPVVLTVGEFTSPPIVGAAPVKVLTRIVAVGLRLQKGSTTPPTRVEGKDTTRLALIEDTLLDVPDLHTKDLESLVRFNAGVVPADATLEAVMLVVDRSATF